MDDHKSCQVCFDLTENIIQLQKLFSPSFGLIEMHLPNLVPMVNVSIGCRDLTIFGRRGGGTDDGGLTLDCCRLISRILKGDAIFNNGRDRKREKGERERKGLVVLIRPP